MTWNNSYISHIFLYQCSRLHNFRLFHIFQIVLDPRRREQIPALGINTRLSCDNTAWHWALSYDSFTVMILYLWYCSYVGLPEIRWKMNVFLGLTVMVFRPNGNDSEWVVKFTIEGREKWGKFPVKGNRKRGNLINVQMKLKFDYWNWLLAEVNLLFLMKNYPIVNAIGLWPESKCDLSSRADYLGEHQDCVLCQLV